jgi:hypothetical protein
MIFTGFRKVGGIESSSWWLIASFAHFACSRLHVLDLTRCHVLGDYLKDTAGNFLRVDAWVIPDSGSNMSQEVLLPALLDGRPAGCQPS